MKFPTKFRERLTNDWSLGLFLLIIYLITHGYRYGWHDHHLEIPLLKSLIDENLYPHDYYVQGLKGKFTSFLYPLLARLISIQQIPSVYFILFLITRYFFFYWTYKFWKLIAQEKSTAFLCVLSSMVMNRVPEFLYMSFSHGELALALMMAGFYYFYKERFLLASAIFGIGANFHAIYSLLPMIFVSSYLLFYFKRHGFFTFLKSSLVYLVIASPFLIWSVQRALATHFLLNSLPLEDWLKIFVQGSPHLFLFSGSERALSEILGNFRRLLIELHPYFFFFQLYLFNCLFNKSFRKEGKNHVIVIMCYVLLFICFLAGYVFPNKFVLLLNFYRCPQFLGFLLLGYLTLTSIRFMDREKLWVGCLLGFLLPKLVGKDLIAVPILAAVTFILLAKKIWGFRRSPLQAAGILLSGLAAILSIYGLGILLKLVNVNPLKEWIFILLNSMLLLTFFILCLPFFKTRSLHWRRLFIIIPLLFFTGWYMNKLQSTFHLNTKEDLLQKDWEQMQHYVREHIPKNAMIFVPYDMPMGGFRIFSERSIVCELRDVGIMGFDYQAMLEWRQRMKDLELFKVLQKESVTPAVINAIKKYGADHIVFMNYYAPHPNDTLQILYANSNFAIYRVHKTPL